MKRQSDTEFREFVALHADEIYNHAFRMLGNREEAEEAVQDIFLKVHRGLEEFRGQSGIRTWIYRITANTCLTRLRKKTREEVHPDGHQPGDQWETISDDGENPEELLIGKDLRSFVITAMERISPDEKELLLLFHVDDLKYEEIADVLDVPLGTVCARLYRARKNLRYAMGNIQKELRR